MLILIHIGSFEKVIGDSKMRRTDKTFTWYPKVNFALFRLVPARYDDLVLYTLANVSIRTDGDDSDCIVHTL